MAMYTTTRPQTTPVSTKLAMLLGVMLVAIGSAWAVTDHIRTTAPMAETSKLPSTALPGTLPNFDHMLQYVSLLVVGVCAAGFLVAARAVCKMR
jgi:hypothetical protein